ncbi:cytochrome b [Marinomonas mediterranea]|jgi:Cytochrome b subunit of the bc complex|uniref:Cytochrome b n=1 Tax=Marinomonas mediterranea (strain ATCC 700492 / JCM 21426 / NBRC 103028 / MMB-1) TaxID=717774 RepID=F2K1C2_MARM1|nr:cytochrome bc complex cytochrome b subunit [Marinomonas mediterranea]ADZ91053.1 Cytochrome b/b6 domain [Marinomonas mediterranea MMB-1]WCN09090.1 cytochrome bc complex cytochrome b subunit [Marinomonas mediterranea]WCN13120.1 cytochrome bc complex cytochrome b subunit [Marinomonas mediterranea]WCN17191.1 cytochrome bc complex cytochrome b subunit [Marinomonas mediterranea MMB-1]
MSKNLLKWIDERLPILSSLRKHLTQYYVPKNLNFFYVFGVFALVLCFNQLITGLWLTMSYTATVDDAFNSIQYIMREVNYGWLIRHMHTTGASFLFAVLYAHMFKAMLYGSYKQPRELVWVCGWMLFVLCSAEAFMGYLLPWGQMSYWGAQVITSLFEVVPFIGDSIAQWIRGDYVVSEVTLKRFFALHVIGVPLLITILVYLHLASLHHVGANNPKGIDVKSLIGRDGKPLDAIPFHPYYTVKDLFYVLLMLTAFTVVVFYVPDFWGYFIEPDNASPANTLSTPEHIAPLWYFAPFYAILRAVTFPLFGVDARLWGVLLMFLSLFLLVLLPWLDRSPVKAMRYKGKISQSMLAAFVASFLVLGLCGVMVPTALTTLVAQVSAVVYFSYFVFMPWYTRFERCHDVPDRV